MGVTYFVSQFFFISFSRTHGCNVNLICVTVKKKIDDSANIIYLVINFNEGKRRRRMGFNGNQTDDFLSSIMVCDPLDEAVSWVKNNLAVEDVFRDEDIKEYCAESFNADDIFSYEILSEWAIENGFVEAGAQ